MNAGVTENYDGDSDNELGATSKEIEGSSDLGGPPNSCNKLEWLVV